MEADTWTAMNSPIAIYQYHTIREGEGSRYYYDTTPNVRSGWALDGIAFYALPASANQSSGTVSIYQFWRTIPNEGSEYYYSSSPVPDQGWTFGGPAFCAFSLDQSEVNTISVYRYYAKNIDREGNRYCYSTKPGLGQEWTLDGKVFQAFANPIKHVFVLMLENHSFDNIFAFSAIPGITAATANNTNTYNDITYNVHGGAPAAMTTDPGHEFPDVLEQLAGPGVPYSAPYPPINNSGFVSNYATSTTEPPHVPPDPTHIGDIMAVFKTAEDLPVIYQLATEFAICDQWFSSVPGPTWPNRFFVHGASSAGLDHSPTSGQISGWELGNGFAYDNGSIYDALKKANIPWRIYSDYNPNGGSYLLSLYSNDPGSGSYLGSFPQVSALQGVSWLGDVSSLHTFAADLRETHPNPYTYQYTFIEPHYGNVVNSTYAGGSSQHPMDDTYGGENLIKAVYEAIRNSPLWPSSMLIITYDEHGGSYDSVAPGPAIAPGDNISPEYNQYGFTFEQYGVRVPAIIVSPLIPKGTVDHSTYDHASIPATVERIFGLSSLTKRDANANDVTGLLSLWEPRTDCPIKLNNPKPSARVSRKHATHEEQEIIDAQPLRQSTSAAFLGILLKTELELSTGGPAEREAIIQRFKAIKTRGQAKAYIDAVKPKLAAAKAAAMARRNRD